MCSVAEIDYLMDLVTENLTGFRVISLNSRGEVLPRSVEHVLQVLGQASNLCAPLVQLGAVWFVNDVLANAVFSFSLC